MRPLESQATSGAIRSTRGVVVHAGSEGAPSQLPRGLTGKHHSRQLGPRSPPRRVQQPTQPRQPQAPPSPPSSPQPAAASEQRSARSAQPSPSPVPSSSTGHAGGSAATPAPSLRSRPKPSLDNTTSKPSTLRSSQAPNTLQSSLAPSSHKQRQSGHTNQNNGDPGPRQQSKQSTAPKSKQGYIRSLRARIQAATSGSGSLPPSLLRDPNVDTYLVDPKRRWSEWTDEKYFKELARGRGTDYVGTEVDADNRRSWPRVAGLPSPSGEPRIEAPPLQRPSNAADSSVSVFWHLAPEGLDAILKGEVGSAPTHTLPTRSTPSHTSDPDLAAAPVAAGGPQARKDVSTGARGSGEGLSQGQEQGPGQGSGQGSGQASSESAEEAAALDQFFSDVRTQIDPFVAAKAAEEQELARQRDLDAEGEEGTAAGQGEATSVGADLTPAQRLAAAARNLRHTLAEAYAEDGSVVVYATRSLLDTPVGPPTDLTNADLPESPALGIPWLPGDVPVPGGVDKLQRLQHVRSLNGLAYTPGELLDMIEYFEAAEEARAGAGKAGSRGTGPRPEAFNPWLWWRERSKQETERKRRQQQEEAQERDQGSGFGSAADVVAGIGPGEGPFAGMGLEQDAGAIGPGAGVQEGLIGMGGPSGAASATSKGRNEPSLSPEEEDLVIEDEVYQILSDLGSDPVIGAVKKALAAARDEEERYRKRVEEREGVPYEVAHLQPGLRRMGLDVETLLELLERGRGGGQGQGSDGRMEGRGQGRQMGGRRSGGKAGARGRGRGRRQTQAPGRRVKEEEEEEEEEERRGVHVPGQEPPAPEQQAVLTVGDILELSAVRLRRLPAGLEAQGVPAGQMLLQELQAFARRQARRTQFNPHSLPAGRRNLACVVSDDPDVLQQLPCTATSDLETIVVTSDMPLGLVAFPEDAAPLLLSWPAVIEGWYLPGSALLSKQLAERQVPPGRGFSAQKIERTRRWQRRRWREEDADSDPAYAQFLQDMQGSSIREGEDEGDDEGAASDGDEL